MNVDEIPLACDLSAIPQHDQHELISLALFAQVELITELDDGYEFVFPVTLLVSLADFITRERLCCPFWDFALRVAPGSDQVALCLRGREGAKAMLTDTVAALKENS